MSISRPLAIVTGASSGIGEAYSRALAGRGMDLLLIARRHDRLERLREELQKDNTGIAVTLRICDLAAPEECRTLARELEELPRVDLLVNNAGCGIPGPFAQADIEGLCAMNRLHGEVPVRLTRAVLPKMLERHQGAIINVSSIAGFLSTPGNVIYGPSKTFLTAFTRTLDQELRGQGITFQALCPGFTRTEFHDTPAYAGFKKKKTPDFLWMPPREVVRISLEALDRKGPVILIPGLKNRLMVLVTRNPAIHRMVRAIRGRLGI